MKAKNGQAQTLRSLHKPGDPLVLCNVYDAATARLVANNPASKALATASYAIAAVAGEDDDFMRFATNLDAIRRISPAALKSGKPLTADLQDGYGDKLGDAIEKIIQLGVVGCNLEDKNNVTGQLYPVEEASLRVKSVLDAAAKAGVPDFVLNARTDTLLKGGSVEEAITRAKAYLDAGATTAFIWGGPMRSGITRAEVETMTKALDGRLNVKLNIGEGYLTVSDLKEIGVARISVGPELYRQAMKAFDESASKVFAS